MVDVFTGKLFNEEGNPSRITALTPRWTSEENSKATAREGGSFVYRARAPPLLKLTRPNSPSPRFRRS